MAKTERKGPVRAPGRLSEAHIEQMVVAFRAWCLNGPDHSTLKFSRRGGSVSLQASAVRGGALELLERFASQD